MGRAPAPHYLRPASVAEALAQRAAHPGSVWLGGATLMLGGLAGPRPDVIIDLCDAGLGRLDVGTDRVHIGATVTVDRLARCEALASPELAALHDAVCGFVPRAVRRIATLGGNVGQGFGSLIAPVALLDGEVELVGPAGARTATVATLQRGADELIVGFGLRGRPGEVTGFDKIRRTPLGPGLVTVAAALGPAGVRLFVGALSMRVQGFDFPGAGVDDVDEVAATVDAGLQAVFDDPRASALYRRAMAGELVRRLLLRLSRPPLAPTIASHRPVLPPDRFAGPAGASPSGVSSPGVSPPGASPSGASPPGASPPGASPSGASPSGGSLQRVVWTAIVDGVEREAAIPANASLAEALRAAGSLALKIACGEGTCGACSAVVDGDHIHSCVVPAMRYVGASVTTAARHADGPVVTALVTSGGLQCGFCTPGMVVAVHALVDRDDVQATPAGLRRGLDGNLCRCTGYGLLVEGAANGLQALRERALLARSAAVSAALTATAAGSADGSAKDRS